MKTIFSLFDNFADTDAAISDLLEMDFDLHEMGLIASKESKQKQALGDLGRKKEEVEVESEGRPRRGIDQLLYRLEDWQISDLGEIFTGGELAHVLAEASSQSSTTDGSLIAALTNFNLPLKTRQAYQNGIKEGRFLFLMRTFDERADEAARVIEENKGVKITIQTP